MKILLVVWLLTGGGIERHESVVPDLEECKALAYVIADKAYEIECLTVWES